MHLLVLLEHVPAYDNEAAPGAQTLHRLSDGEGTRK
jgi:hypothetical protein